MTHNQSPNLKPLPSFLLILVLTTAGFGLGFILGVPIHDALFSLMATGWTALLSVRPYPGPQGGLEPTGLIFPRFNSYHRTLTKS